VALAEGGASETVVDGETGVLVQDRSTDAFAAGISRLRGIPTDTDRLRRHAESFSRERFLTDFKRVVEDAVREPPPPAAREPQDYFAASRTPTPPPAAREDEK
jgi:glycosyltransferase involved in cell wall biosynthesis